MSSKVDFHARSYADVVPAPREAGAGLAKEQWMAVEGASQGYRGPQVCSIVGISYRQLDYWARTGLLRPSVAQATGSGSQRLYSYRDLLELKVIKRLLDAGINLQQARCAIDCLRSGLGEDLSSASLVLAGAGSVLVQTGDALVDLLRGGQGVFNVVPLAGVIDELEAAVHEFAHSVPQARGAASSGPTLMSSS